MHGLWCRASAGSRVDMDVDAGRRYLPISGTGSSWGLDGINKP